MTITRLKERIIRKKKKIEFGCKNRKIKQRNMFLTMTSFTYFDSHILYYDYLCDRNTLTKKCRLPTFLIPFRIC